MASMNEVLRQIDSVTAQPSVTQDLVRALEGCIDSLEYVNRMHPDATGWGVRLQRIADAKDAIAKARSTP